MDIQKDLGVVLHKLNQLGRDRQESANDLLELSFQPDGEEAEILATHLVRIEALKRAIAMIQSNDLECHLLAVGRDRT